MLGQKTASCISTLLSICCCFLPSSLITVCLVSYPELNNLFSYIWPEISWLWILMHINVWQQSDHSEFGRNMCICWWWCVVLLPFKNQFRTFQKACYSTQPDGSFRDSGLILEPIQPICLLYSSGLQINRIHLTATSQRPQQVDLTWRTILSL